MGIQWGWLFGRREMNFSLCHSLFLAWYLVSTFGTDSIFFDIHPEGEALSKSQVAPTVNPLFLSGIICIFGDYSTINLE